MTQKTAEQFSPELRERAVRMVQNREREGGTQRESVGAIAAKFGCSRETPRRWVGQGEWDAAERPDLTTEERERIRNHRRLLEPTGNIPPAEAEANHDAATRTPATAA